MKILLISPCADPLVRTTRIFLVPQLSLHILAGLTPPDHEVKIVEEEIEEIDLEDDVDLVGISCFTSNAPRAYALAQEFRKRGKKVVLGGIHPSVLPEEALRYADTVVVGEAEGVWEQLLSDFEKGNLHRKYHRPEPSLDRYIPMRGKTSIKTSWFPITPVMTTRGCPYDCEFCSVGNLYGKKIRHVPVRHVVRYMEEIGGKVYTFLDDNIIGDPKYAKELFRAIKPLRIQWAGEVSISFARDEEMMKLAAGSGCVAMFFGLESVSADNLHRMKKSLKEMKEIEEAIRRVKSFGIHFHPSFVLGFDADTKDIFPETVDFLFRNNIGTFALNTLTPYPGTRIYEQYRRENRILTRDWKYYNSKNVVFRPQNMTPLDLHIGRLWSIRQFCKTGSIARRINSIPRRNLMGLSTYFGFNLGCRKETSRDIKNFPDLALELFPSELSKDRDERLSDIRSVFDGYDDLYWKYASGRNK
jgi:radical SAM superfamily enzyme YgiQ (UPF0313 family)